jgi:hypothetical protein
MTFQKNLISFPVLDTLLKLLEDRQWHNKHLIKNKWKHAIPPEYFARRRYKTPYLATSSGKIRQFRRTIDGTVSVQFAKAIRHLVIFGFIELRELSVKHRENYDVLLTDKGWLLLQNKQAGKRSIAVNKGAVEPCQANGIQE